MRYKEGDKIVIRKDLDVAKRYCMDDDESKWTFFAGMMNEFVGEQEIVSTKYGMYQLSTNYRGINFNFTDEMIDHDASEALNLNNEIFIDIDI